MATFIAAWFLGLRVLWATSASALSFSSCDVRDPVRFPGIASAGFLARLAAAHNAARRRLCEGQRRTAARSCRVERFGMVHLA